MKVLLDENTPIVLKSALIETGFDCVRVQDLSWDGKRNGELLGLAESNFDAFVTLDTNLEFQQNLGNRSLGFVVMKLRLQVPPKCQL